MFWLVFIYYIFGNMREDTVPEVFGVKQEMSLPRWERGGHWLLRYAELARLWLSQDLDENRRAGNEYSEKNPFHLTLYKITLNVIIFQKIIKKDYPQFSIKNFRRVVRSSLEGGLIFYPTIVCTWWHNLTSRWQLRSHKWLYNKLFISVGCNENSNCISLVNNNN